MSRILEKIVAVAAIMYLLERTIALRRALRTMILARTFNKIFALYESTCEEIQPIFETWWEEMAERIGRIIDTRQFDEEWGFTATPTSELFREQAWLLAMHARSSEAEQNLINELPRFGGLRQRMSIAYHRTHDRPLQEAADQMLLLDIDPDELRAHFASSS